MKLKKFEDFNKMNEGAITIFAATYFFILFLKGLIKDIKRRKMRKQVPEMKEEEMFETLIDAIETVRNAGIDVYRNGSINNIYTKKKLVASFNSDTKILSIGNKDIKLTDTQSERLKGVIQFYYRK